MTKRINKNLLLALFEKVSKIKSFLKKPERKKSPQREIIVISSVKRKKREFTLPAIKNRLSCWQNKKWRYAPTIKKRSLLKKACAHRCSKQTHLFFNPNLKKSIPICLKVERATIFLKSISFIELNPAKNIVISPIKKRLNNRMFEEKKKNFKIRAIPAATSVEEWTKAEIGVGAAIAAGSQEENGNCALFVSAVINKSIVGTNTRTLIEVGVIKRKKQNKIIISPSPNRLLKIVIILLFNLFQLE